MPKILLLGSGFVAQPSAEYVLRRPENFLTIGSRRLESAQELAKDFPADRVAAVQVDSSSQEALDALVQDHDLVISLVPYIHHPTVIRSALKFKKHVVTTSYVSETMQSFDQEAKDAGVTILNEVGVDPGIDHFYALKTINEVHAAGGKIKSFISWCGGLPAPEASNNPLGYKFSWSPRGVLLAIRNTARFKENGKIVEVPGPQLLRSAREVHIYPAFAVEGYPNRDSTPYDNRYKIPEAETILRGTLRYKGNPKFMQTLVDIGFLSDTPVDFLQASAVPVAWKTVLSRLLSSASESEEDLKNKIVQITGLEGEEKERILRGFKWLGLFSDNVAPLKGSYLDSLCATLESKMAYKEGERDMVLLQHKFEIELADGTKQSRTSTLVEYGIPNGTTAMAKTVGVPCGIAVQLILDGVITRRGVLAPMTADIYQPIMDLLEKENVHVIEETL